ncbi:hypothetical protein QOT17_25606 [Balamuthia mandrillaris]
MLVQLFKCWWTLVVTSNPSSSNTIADALPLPPRFLRNGERNARSPKVGRFLSFGVSFVRHIFKFSLWQVW